MSSRFLLLLLLASATASLSLLGCAPKAPAGDTIATVTVTSSPTPPPPSSNGTATVAYAGSNLTFSQVAAACSTDNGIPFCTVNWLGLVTTAGGASGHDVIVNSLELFTDQSRWANGTLTGTTSGTVGTITYFTYRENFGPGGTSANPTNLAALVSSSGISFALSAVNGTGGGASYSINASGQGEWLLFVGSAGNTTPVTNTQLGNASAAGVLDPQAF